MPELKLNFDVYCECGHLLTAKVPISRYHSAAQVDIEPCPNCLKKAHANGYYQCEFDNDLQ